MQKYLTFFFQFDIMVNTMNKFANQLPLPCLSSSELSCSPEYLRVQGFGGVVQKPRSYG